MILTDKKTERQIIMSQIRIPTEFKTGVYFNSQNRG